MTMTEALWEISMNGFHDAECGEAETTGWYGLIRGPFESIPVMPGDADTASAYATLSGLAGGIVSQDSQGFKDSETFATVAELETAWARIEAECASDESDDAVRA